MIATESVLLPYEVSLVWHMPTMLKGQCVASMFSIGCIPAERYPLLFGNLPETQYLPQLLYSKTFQVFVK